LGFGLRPRKYVLGGVHTGATCRIPLNRPHAAATQPVVKLLWSLVISIANHCDVSNGAEVEEEASENQHQFLVSSNCTPQ